MLAKLVSLLLLTGALLSTAGAQLSTPVKRPNILWIVADDMNWDSPGCFGGAAEGVTPNIDKLAAQGMRFSHAYVNVSICLPSRCVMLTGRYPHRNGAEGFQRMHPGIPTLPALLNEAGYFCGTVGKPLSQEEVFRWSVAYRWPGAGDEDRWGRDPAVFKEFCQRFFAMTQTAHQPFFLMASSHDPHRPFARGNATKKPDERAESSRTFQPNEVTLSGLVPDLPDARQEFSAYATSVRRLDDMVGTVLKELEASGLADETIVVFLSDHGMPFPGAKFNCYPDSVRTPMIIRWPGKVAPSSVEKTHMISMVDLQPTILEAAGLEPSVSDGRSFLPLLFGKAQEGREAVFTQFHHIHGKDALPMRSVITRTGTYVFNPWSNGERRFTRLGGSTFAAMKESAKNDLAMAKRVKHLEYRTVEEFFDRRKDPHCRENLIANKDYQVRIEALQSKLRAWMVTTEDPALAAFDHRDQPDAMESFVQKYRAAAQRTKDELRAYEREKGYRF